MTQTPAPYRTTEHDDVAEAAALFGGAQADLFAFAEAANAIVGKRDGGTQRLAQKIKREVDTVERYAAAGALWLAMLKHYPSDSEIIRDNLDVSFWMAVGTRFKADVRDIISRYDGKPLYEIERLAAAELLEAVNRAKAFLTVAVEERLTVERLRALIPTRKSGESPFTRAAKRIVNIMERDILNAPALNSNMNEQEYSVFLKVSKWLVKFLKEKMT